MPKGRKRKNVKREKNGRPQRENLAHDPNHQFLMRKRVAITGSEKLSETYPLQILLGRKLLSKNDAEAKNLHDAGMWFAELYYRLFGMPFASCPQERRMGRVSGAKALRDQRAFENALAALDATTGRAEVMDLAVYLNYGWLIPEIVKGPVRDKHRRKIGRLVDGLKALNSLRPARVSSEEAELAEAQVA